MSHKCGVMVVKYTLINIDKCGKKIGIKNNLTILI